VGRGLAPTPEHWARIANRRHAGHRCSSPLVRGPMRMVGTLLAEQDDEWLVSDRRCFGAGSMEGGTSPKEVRITRSYSLRSLEERGLAVIHTGRGTARPSRGAVGGQSATTRMRSLGTRSIGLRSEYRRVAIPGTSLCHSEDAQGCYAPRTLDLGPGLLAAMKDRRHRSVVIERVSKPRSWVKVIGDWHLAVKRGA
jgi:hypothetical protein